ncbi:MAG TPA: DUF4124 domain-containing protein [Betaproteobacteria bacterium]|nr:DUF4124 domain-containing protein [Betaproteobacteria bacterium]
MRKIHAYFLSTVLAGLVLVVALPAQAAIYKYVDKQGNVTYTNIPVKGAKRVTLEPITTITPSRLNRETPARFPRVKAGAQRKRDSVRRKILGNEQAAEQKLLDAARKALAEGKAVRLGSEHNYQKYLDRIQKLKDNVIRHEKNIQALKKEIAITK